MISPLLWRIFYDPLIERIQKDETLGYVMDLEVPTNITTDHFKRITLRQAVLAYADDTTWITQSKVQMEKLIKIAEEFFHINDIHINGEKSKLLVLNSEVEKPDRYVNFCNSEVREESTNSITRFLGIWLNTKMKETLIKAKAKGIVRATVMSLYPKKLTWGQLAYLNNVCIIPKLIYMLQTTRLSEYELQEIHRPLLKLIKNKAELQVTTSTSLLKHKGLGNCRALADELFQKQVISLYKRLNSTGTEALATELRLRQGFNDARIVNVMSDLGKIDNIKKIWKCNLACLVLLKAEELKFHFNFSSELWQIEQGGTPLNEVLGKVFNRKTADALKRLNLFTTAQLISADGSELITWSQLKLCKKQSRRGRKPRWFIALENCLIGDRRNRKLVPEYVISDYNSLALSIALPAVSLDKRKKELVLVENKDNDKKIFKIIQKGKAKILGEHYCNIPLADPNQFEIKKCKGCSGNTAKMTGKVDEEVCMSHFS